MSALKHTFQLLLQLFALAAAIADNFAVIVGSSRYWHNYRHESNALSIYAAVRSMGIPDGNIILFIADPVACNPRNTFPGTMYLDTLAYRSSLLDNATQIDYQGRDATVENFLQVLTGKQTTSTPLSKQLNSGPSSNILLYLTGHGYDEMFKFHDHEELLAVDFANALQQMHLAERYGQMLIILDTCQAASMFNEIRAPNIVGIASSKLGQSSYAHMIDLELGVHLADQFTFFLSKFLMDLQPNSRVTLADLFAYISAQGISSTLVPWASAVGRRPLQLVNVMEFFSQNSSHVGFSTTELQRTDSNTRLMFGVNSHVCLDAANQVFSQPGVPLDVVGAMHGDQVDSVGQRGLRLKQEEHWQLEEHCPSQQQKTQDRHHGDLDIVNAGTSWLPSLSCSGTVDKSKQQCQIIYDTILHANKL